MYIPLYVRIPIYARIPIHKYIIWGEISCLNAEENSLEQEGQAAGRGGGGEGAGQPQPHGGGPGRRGRGRAALMLMRVPLELVLEAPTSRWPTPHVAELCQTHNPLPPNSLKSALERGVVRGSFILLNDARGRVESLGFQEFTGASDSASPERGQQNLP